MKTTQDIITGTLSGSTTAAESAVLRSLARAYNENVHGRFWSLKPVNGKTTGWYEGVKFIVYLVQINRCECKAGQMGLMCKHRASLADLTGEMDKLIPDFYERFTPPMTAPISVPQPRFAEFQIAI